MVPAFSAATSAGEAAVDLYWLPLGAGGRSVRLNGIVYEAISARIERRSRCDVYHSALEIRVASRLYAVEMTPIPNERRWERGVVAEGPVGTRSAGRLRTWGRDELGAGEMWTCNSIVSWVLTRAGVDPGAIAFPPRARAPGWDAGITVARRQVAPAQLTTAA